MGGGEGGSRRRVARGTSLYLGFFPSEFEWGDGIFLIFVDVVIFRFWEVL